MTTISIPGFIVGKTARDWEEPRLQGMKLQHWDFRPSEDSDYVVVCEHTLTFEVPADFDSRPAQIKAIEAKQRDLDAKYAAASSLLKQQIASLRAIEHTEAA